MITNTPKPPYYAVIFTSERTDIDDDYAGVNDHLEEHAAKIDGFIGIESVRDGLGISISYWRDLAAIQEWRIHSDHIAAKEKGKTDWYEGYSIRICRVEQDKIFKKV